MHVSQVELAAIFRRSTRTIQRWDGEGLDRARVTEDATSVAYDLAEAVAWRLEREADQGDEDSPLQAARVRELEARAEARELELQIRRREYVAVEDVVAEWDEACATIRAEILRLPVRHGDVVRPDDPAAGEEVLEQVADDLLRALQKALSPPDVDAQEED